MAVSSSFASLFGQPTENTLPSKEGAVPPSSVIPPPAAEPFPVEGNVSDSFKSLFQATTEPSTPPEPITGRDTAVDQNGVFGQEPPEEKISQSLTFEPTEVRTPTVREMANDLVAEKTASDPFNVGVSSFLRFIGKGAEKAGPVVETETMKTGFLNKAAGKEVKQGSGKKIAAAGRGMQEYAQAIVPDRARIETLGKKIEEIDRAQPGIATSFKTGDISGALDGLYFDVALSGSKEDLNKVQKLREEFERVVGVKQDQGSKRNWFIKTVDATAEMMPMLLKSAAISTVPVAGPIISSSMWARQGTGDMLSRFDKEGIPRDIGIPIAVVAGIAYSLIEQVEVGQVMNTGVKKAVGESIKKKVVDLLKEKGKDWVKENFEEVAQSLVTEAAFDLASKESGKQLDPREMARRYSELVYETFKQSAGPMAILSLGGVGAGGIKIAAESRNKKQTVTETPPGAPPVAGEENIEINVTPPPVSGNEGKPGETNVPAENIPAQVPGENQITPAKPVEEEIQDGETDGMSLSDFGITVSDFYDLNPDNQDEIYNQLSSNEQERILSNEPPALSIEEIKKRVEEVERPPEEKKEIENVEHNPTDKQISAGNYRKGHIKRGTFEISIETAAGSERKGLDSEKRPWKTEINHDYGYIRGTKGADAYRTKDGTDQLDVFINPGSKFENEKSVYVVNQVDPGSGNFDEHKIMMGFDSEDQARVAYLSNYEPGWKGLGSIYEMPMEEFKTWSYSEKTKFPYRPDLEKNRAEVSDIEATEDQKKKADELASQIPGVTVKGVTGGSKVNNKTIGGQMHFNDANNDGSTITLSLDQGIEDLKAAVEKKRKESPKNEPNKAQGKKRGGKEKLVPIEEVERGTGMGTGTGTVDGDSEGNVETDNDVQPAIQIGPEKNAEAVPGAGKERSDLIPIDEVERNREQGEEGSNNANPPPVEEKKKPDKNQLATIIASFVNKSYDKDSKETPEQREARVARINEGAVKQAEDLITNINEKDLGALISRLSVMENKGSRAAFMAYTGIKLPKTVRETIREVRKFVGKDVADKFDADNKAKAEERKKKDEERRIEELKKQEDKTLIRYEVKDENGQTKEMVDTFRRYIQHSIDIGYVNLKATKRGKFTQWQLSDDGQNYGYPTTKVFKKRSEYEIVKELLDEYNKKKVVEKVEKEDYEKNKEALLTRDAQEEPKGKSVEPLPAPLSAEEKKARAKKIFEEKQKARNKTEEAGASEPAPVATGEQPEYLKKAKYKKGDRVVTRRLGAGEVYEITESNFNKGTPIYVVHLDNTQRQPFVSLSEEGIRGPEKKPTSAQDKIDTEKKKQEEALRRAQDALNRLGRSFGSTMSMAGTEQAEIAFEAVSALVEAGYREFKIVAIKVGELAKDFINIQAFREAIEDAYDAYTEVDTEIEKRTTKISDHVTIAEENLKNNVPNDIINQENNQEVSDGLEGNSSEELAGKPPEDVQAAGRGGGTGTTAGAGGEKNKAGNRGTGRGRRRTPRSKGDSSPEVYSPTAGARAGDSGGGPGVSPGLSGDHISTGDLNYTPSIDEKIGAGGLKTKYRDNVTAIKILLQLESENRKATTEEQQKLIRYVGWGAMPQVFDSNKKGWKAEHKELKALLSDKKLWDAALSSTTNAHYTSPTVVKAMWSAMRRMGFTGGSVFEPGCGIGHFYGFKDNDLKCSYTGIEMDLLTARIAAQLYQNSTIQALPFEEYIAPANRFDVAIGNVPFSGKIFPYDKNAKKYGMEPRKYALHDFFFLKTLYSIKPGGVVAFITSRYTMDKRDADVRAKIAETADFVGAIRLPSTAFKENAGTDVVTDIIFLKKRAEGENMSPLTKWEFIKTAPVEFDMIKGEGKKTEFINQYFVNNPARVLGKQDLSGTMYTGDQYNVVLGENEIDQRLQDAVSSFPENVINIQKQETDRIEGEMVKSLAPDNVIVGGYFLKGGKLYQKVDDENSTVVTGNKDNISRISGMVAVKTSIKELLKNQYETDDDEKIKPLFAKLNRVYDGFVKKFGYLHEKKNVAAFEDDPDGALLLALERWDRAEKKATKADIFTKRTLRRHNIVESADNPQDAILVSLSERGGIDWQYMSDLTGMSVEMMQQDLLGKGIIFKDPESIKKTGEPAFVTREEYLSGNVRIKLKEAQAAAERDPSLSTNVSELEKVIPEDLGPSDITVRINSPIILEDDIKEFCVDIFGANKWHLVVEHERTLGKWNIKYKGYNNDKIENIYGVPRKNAIKLLDALLNNKTIEVVEYDDLTNKKIILTEETNAAKAKAEEIINAWNEWLWKDPDRTQRISRDYNDLYNAVVDRKYTHPIRVMDKDAKVNFPGCTYTMRPHQADAVWRVVQSKNTLLGHVVGAGKTLEMICGGMELKRLGLRKKPMYVVPNHMVEQWAGDFRSAYPGAKVLVATDKNFSPEQRKVFLNKIATFNWDAIIVKQSHFIRMPMSQQATVDYLDSKLQVYRDALEKARANGDRLSVKDIEAMIKNYEQRIKKLLDSPKDTGVIEFDMFGIDQLFIDEMDMFKNLDFYSQRKVLGLGSRKGSEKSTDLAMKVQHIQKAGGGITGATGTPISNSMAETYHMMRYLQPELLKDLRIENFAEWANSFAMEVTSWELNNSGSGYKQRTRFSKFVNVPELMTMLRQTWDIQTADMLEKAGILVRGKNLPNVVYKTISAPSTKLLKSFINFLKQKEKYAQENPKEAKGGILKIIGLGRKAAVDMRLLSPTFENDPDFKLNHVADGIADLTKKYPGKTGLVFYDLTKPDKDARFSPHYELRKLLIERGVNPKEIAFIHDFNTDEKKLTLFDNMNSGKIRVLIGSTEKMGAGTNVQRLLKWMVHIDSPWRPRDIEQREGRIIRQGNTNDEIEIYRYVTKGSYDIAMWNLLDIKAKVIRQVMSGEDKTTREIDDESSFSSVMMMAVDNPMVKESMELRQEIQRIENLKRNWVNNNATARMNLQSNPKKIQDIDARIESSKKDLKTAGPKPEKFEITINGKKYDDRTKAGAVIVKVAEGLLADMDRRGAAQMDSDIIGEIGNLPFYIQARGYFKEKTVELVVQGEDRVYYSNYSSTPHINCVHLSDSIWHENYGIAARIKTDETRKEKLQKDIEYFKTLVDKPFELGEKLETDKKRFQEVMGELAKYEEEMKTKEAAESDIDIDWMAIEAGWSKNTSDDEDGDPVAVEVEERDEGSTYKKGDKYELARPSSFYINIRKDGATVFEKVEKAVPVPTDIDVDAFTYKKGKPARWAVAEGVAGKQITSGHKTKAEAIETANRVLNTAGSEKIAEVIPTNLESTGLSPRYRIVEPGAGVKFASGKNADTFYSPLLRTIRGLKQEKGTGEQFFNMITRAPGVKESEWKWIGLDDFLKGKQKITRQEIENFVSENQVQVEVVEKDQKVKPKSVYDRSFNSMGAARKFYDEYNNTPGAFDADLRIGDIVFEDGYIILTNDAHRSDYMDETKYSKYTLPGGENYREVLLTLPEKLLPKKELTIEQASDFITNRGAVEVKKEGKFVKNVMSEFGLNEFRDGGYEFYEYGEWKPQVKGKYMSSHWEDPNVIAHIRLNDREANGEKVLFVEEIQSDWAREARDKGVYGVFPENVLIAAVKGGMNKDAAKSDIDFLLEEPLSKPGRDTGDQLRRLGNAIDRSGEDIDLNEVFHDRKRDGVPAQPFLKNWEDLTLKRILRMAAEEGYDRVAWINGEQTADRYDLSKQLSKVTASKIESGSNAGTYLIEAEDKNGKTVIEQPFTKENLPNIVGKDLANKIVGDLEGVPAYMPSGLKNKVNYSGLDLKVGGEWATNLYDRMIPKFYEKYGKKWGVKVEPVNFQDEYGNTSKKYGDFMDSMAEKYEFFGPWGQLMNKLSATEKKKAVELRKAQPPTDGPGIQQSIPITEEMKESVLSEGQPLFAPGRDNAVDTAYPLTDRYESAEEQELTEAIFSAGNKPAIPGTVKILDPEEETINHVVRLLEDFTGKYVTVINSDNRTMRREIGRTIDGLSSPTSREGFLKDRVFIDQKSTRPVLWTAFHELWHFIEMDPQLQKSFWGAVKLTDAGKAALAKMGKSEFAADIFGEMMQNPKVLETLSKNDARGFKRILAEFIKILQKLKTTIQKQFGYSLPVQTQEEFREYIQNVDELQSEIIRIMGEYSKNENSRESAPAKITFAAGRRGMWKTVRLPLIPREIPNPTNDQRVEAKEEAAARLKKVQDFQKEMNILRAKLRNLPQQQLEQRAEIGIKIRDAKNAQLTEIKYALYDYAKKIGLKGVPYNKVDLVLRNTGTVGGLQKTLDRLDKVWLDYERSSIVEKVMQAVENEYRKIKRMQTGKTRPTRSVEANNRMLEYLNELSGTPESFEGDYPELVNKMINYFNLYAKKDIKKAESITDLPQDFVNWMNEPSNPVPEGMKRMIRSMFRQNISVMTTDELKRVLENIQSIDLYGRTTLEQQEDERKKAIEALAEEQSRNIRQATGSTPENPFEKAVGNRKLVSFEWLGKQSKNAFWSFIDPERMVEWLTGWSGYEGLKRAVLRPLYAAEEKKIVNVKKANELFAEIHSEIGWRDTLLKKHFTLDLEEIYNANDMKYTGKKPKIDITLDNMMFVYANTKNPGNLAHLRGMFESDDIADSVIASITNRLPKEHKQAVDRMIQHYDDNQWARMNEVFERDMNVMMPKEAGYFPIQNIATDRAESAVVADYLARNSNRFSSLQKGMTKSRVHSKAPFRKMSYFDTVMKNMQQVEHYIAYNDAVRDVQRFLNNPMIKDAIEGKSPEVQKELNGWIKAVAYGRVSGSENIVDKVFDFMRKNFTTYALGFKVTTMLQQLSSLPKGMADINKMYVLKSATAFMMNPIKAEKFSDEKSVMMENRAKSYERELAEFFEKQVAKKYGGLKSVPDFIIQASMWHIGKMDKIVATILWNAKYEEQMHIHGNESAAVQAADEVIRKTQSRGGVLYMPSIYRGGGVVRAFTIFTSDLNQNINLAFEMAGKWKNQSTAKNVNDVFYNFLAPTLIVWLVNNALEPAWSAIKSVIRPDEPEDYRPEELVKEFFTQMTGGIPLITNLIDAAVASAMDQVKEARGLIPDRSWQRYAADMTPAGVEVIEQLTNFAATGKPEALFEALMIFSGVPYRNIKRIATGVSEVKEHGAGEWRRGIWSERQLKEQTVFNSMARRLYKTRPNSDDIQVYKEWMSTLSEYEKRNFADYTKAWYRNYIKNK